MASPIIGTSGQYPNPRGNPRHVRTSSGQGFQNLRAAVGNAYLLEDITAGATGEVRFIDPATEEIDTVMTPIIAKNVSQVDFQKSAIVTYFRFPGIDTPLLLTGDENGPEIVVADPVGAWDQDDFHSVIPYHPVSLFDSVRVEFTDPDPGGDGSGDYTLTVRVDAEDVNIVVGNSGLVDNTNPLVFNTYVLTGTLTELTNFFSGSTTGSFTMILPHGITIVELGLAAPDGRTTSTTRHVVGQPFHAGVNEIYVSSSGDDDDGTGTSANPYATIEHALDTVLGQNILLPGGTYNIIVKDGTLTHDAPLIIDSKYADRITIKGENVLSPTISSVQSSSGSAGAWSVVLNVSSVTGISVGQYAIIRETSGGSNPLRLIGVHEITNVDAVNTRITVLVKHLASATASGAVSGFITIPKSILLFEGCIGLELRHGLGLLDDICIIGDDTAGTRGVQLTSFENSSTEQPKSSDLFMARDVGVSGFAIGVFVNGGTARLNGAMSGMSSSGLQLRNRAAVIVGEMLCCCNAFAGAMVNGAGCSLNTTSSVSCYHGNQYGLFVNLGGMAGMSNAVADSNTLSGILTSTGASAILSGFTATSNSANGIQAILGSNVDAFDITTNNNGNFGVVAQQGSVVYVTTISASGNTFGTYFPSTPDQLSADGAFIHVSGKTGVSMQADFEIISTADQTVTNNTLQDHSTLQFAVTSGEAWDVDLYCEISGNNTTGDCALTLATTGTWGTTESHWNALHYSAAGAVTGTGATAAASTTLMAASPGTTANNGDGSARPVYFKFRFHATGTGTVKVQFGQVAAAAGRTTTIHKGARLIARRIRQV